ncbi:maltotriose-binding protein [Halarchaeum grantii]|uniref:Maltotriose-binding protein n=1 Tax=Halarchaeum grantii TaxID=1193105 RepID=A0A830F4T6_9EURY|nr:extracellular solute-binding protein [Halarchaeum grantii]GGL39276.1 maltotriose-binding protein [Halarchaeum grantii]
MTSNRREFIAGVGSASALVALTGCVGVQQSESTPSGDASSDGGDTTTERGGTATAWYALTDTEQPLREDAITAFNEQSPHTVEGADISSMEKKTTSAIPAGQGPQSFEHAHDWVGDYTQRGFLADQTGELDVSLDTFTSAAADAVQFDGQIVGLPHAAETVTLIYNTDIVDEPPETVAEMVDVMADYHDPSKNQYGLGYPFNPYFTSSWLQAFGGYYFDASKDDMLGIDKDPVVEGLQFALDNFKPYMPNDPTYEPQASIFASGNAAFAINGPWYLSTLNEKGVNYEVTTPPKPEGGEANPYTGVKMWYFSKAMREGGPATEAGRSFVEWFATNEDHILQRAEQQGSIPVLASLVGSDDLPGEVKAFSEAVDQGTPMPTHPKVNKVWPPVESALIKAFNGDATPEAALSQAAETVRSNWE